MSALAAVAVLVLLYRYDRWRRTIPVGTLFLWQSRGELMARRLPKPLLAFPVLEAFDEWSCRLTRRP